MLVFKAVCVPMAQDLLGWDEGEISGFYSVSGVVVSSIIEYEIAHW